MNSETVRGRLNAIIVRLERFSRLSANQQKAGLEELKEWVDRELRRCSADMLELRDAEFNAVLSKIIALLQQIGVVVLVAMASQL